MVEDQRIEQARCPQRETDPAPRRRKGSPVAHLREGIKSNPQNESPDPAKDLRMAMSLQPCRGQLIERLAITDRDQIPHAQKSAWQQQEEQASDDVGSYQCLQLSLPAGRIFGGDHHFPAFSISSARGKRILFSR